MLRLPPAFALLPALAFLLAACSPDLDWRELAPEGARFSAWFPARTSMQARPLPGTSPPVLLTQWSARARETVFAVGYADYEQPPEQAALELSDALVRNITGQVRSRRAIALGAAQGIETVASGMAGDQPLQLTVRIYVSGRRLYQLAVLGKPGDLSESELDTFFAAFKITAGL
jgi:hypothetical protein